MRTPGPARRADVEWAELDGEVVLYDPAAHVLHRLNPEAAAVWAACDGPSTLNEIIGAIDQAYAGSRHVIARDVAVVIDRLRQLGLLQEAPDEGDADR